MIGFQDKTFCIAFPTRCSNKECHRAYTQDVNDAAVRWWEEGKDPDDSSGPPVAFGDLSEGCEDIISADG